MPQDKPPKVALNLDTLEREGDQPEPFMVVFQGKPMTFQDAQELDHQQLRRAMYEPTYFFQIALSREDSKRFLAAKVPTWKIEELMSAYNEHYGLDTPGNANASPTS